MWKPVRFISLSSPVSNSPGENAAGWCTLIPASRSCFAKLRPVSNQEGTVLVSIPALDHRLHLINESRAGPLCVSGAIVLENCTEKSFGQSFILNCDIKVKTHKCTSPNGTRTRLCSVLTDRDGDLHPQLICGIPWPSDK